jgi:hypothetical protein
MVEPILSMKRFFRKALIWLARAFATLVVLLLIFYAEEDWRGARDWAACQKELEAKGETLDLRQLAPPGKPEDDLSKVPIFAELYQANEEYLKTKRSTFKPRIRGIKIDLKPSNYGDILPKQTNAYKGEPVDLSAWQKYYRATPEAHLPEQPGTPAQDVLQAMSQFDPELNEIDAAVSNPKAHWPMFEPTTFPSYAGGMVALAPVARVIQLKAVAHFDNNETDLAEKDYLFCFRLIQPLTKGGDLLNYAIVAAVRADTDTILWEGLRRHAWNDGQLREMEAALSSTDMLTFATDSFRIERAWMIEEMEVCQNSNWDVVGTAEYNDLYYDLGLYHLPISSLRPKGWWDEDRSSYSYGMQAHLDAFKLSHGTLSSSPFPFHDMSASWGWNRADTSLWSAIYVPISALVFPSVDNIGPRIAKAEIYRRLARLACRLEEYRLAHGQYPDTLDDLPDLPAHLNQEVLSEEPLRYQRKGDGYQLYSVGWDQKDDGGVLATDDKVGDWPWPSP